MKKDYSSSVSNSLSGRQNSSSFTIGQIPSNPPVDPKLKTDRGLGLNADGTFRQSNAGRKTKPNKKVQLTLTLKPETKEVIDQWASSKPRSATNYLSEYVEEHLNEIMNYFSK